MKGLIISALFVFSLPVFAQQFSQGNNLSAHVLEGRVTVRCSDPRGGFDINTIYCQDHYINGSSHDYFLYDLKGKKAKKVTLISQRADGKEIKKTKKFDYKEGKSKKRFNLWIETLFQRALLDYGENKIEFIFHNGDEDEPVERGQFVVVVENEGTFTCRNGYFNSNDLNDCRGGSATICSQYFRYYNYCR